MTVDYLYQYDTDPDLNTQIGAIGIDGSVNAVSNFDNALRLLMAHLAQYHAADTIASAATCDLSTKAAYSLTITGTVNISAFGSVKAGTVRLVTFEGILTLTHNATSLILPGGTDITTAANDTALLVSLGSGNWRCAMYQRAAATATYLEAANNLSDVASAATSRSNLGLVIGTDVQAYSALLGTLAALSVVSGDIVYGSAANTLSRLAKGTDGQYLSLASGLPAWADIPSSIPTLTAGSKPWSTASGPVSTTNSSYTKVSSIYAPGTGTVRASFGLKRTSGGGGTAYGKIYVNGVAAGTEKSTTGSSYITQTSDVSVTAGDTVELWLKQSGATSSDANAFFIGAAEDPPFGVPF